jgi:hypothetical protein
MSKLPVTVPDHITPEDSLSRISDVITNNLKKWDCFDISLHTDRLEAVKRVVKARDLEWRDAELEYQDEVVIVVGVKGADFKKHEEDR